MSNRKYTNEQVAEAVSTSISYRQVLSKINLKEAGGNYSCIKKLIQELNLDISHFKGRSWNKGNIIGPKRPIEDYLSNKASITTWKLKNRLLKENILEHYCFNCKGTEWLGNPIPLELHHKDGDNLNNNLSNFELLCPNCHALTPNYRSKNSS